MGALDGASPSPFAADALWAGVPVITLPGQHMAARVASSLVTLHLSRAADDIKSLFVVRNFEECVRAFACPRSDRIDSLGRYHALAVALARSSGDVSPDALLTRARAAFSMGRKESLVFDVGKWMTSWERVSWACVARVLLGSCGGTWVVW